MRATMPIIAVVVCACGPSGSPEPAAGAPHAATPDDRAMQSFLSAHVWTQPHARLELHADATYTMQVNGDDYTSTPTHGSWGFVLRGDDAGQLFLGPLSALRFARRGDALELDDHAWTAGAALPPTAVNERLFDPKTPELLARLSSTAWVKSDDFDTYAHPDWIRFEAGGTFQASYRGGTCKHGGTFSLAGGELHPSSDANVCDLRGPTTAQIAASNDAPRFQGDLLVLYSASYAPEGKLLHKEFFKDTYGDRSGMRIHGVYDGALVAGIATTVALHFENRMSEPLTVTRAHATLTAAAARFGDAGPPQTLLDRTYASLVVPPGGAQLESIELTPASGFQILSIEIDATGRTQPWHGRAVMIMSTP